MKHARLRDGDSQMDGLVGYIKQEGLEISSLRKKKEVPRGDSGRRFVSTY